MADALLGRATHWHRPCVHLLPHRCRKLRRYLHSAVTPSTPSPVVFPPPTTAQTLKLCSRAFTLLEWGCLGACLLSSARLLFILNAVQQQEAETTADSHATVLQAGKESKVNVTPGTQSEPRLLPATTQQQLAPRLAPCLPPGSQSQPQRWQWRWRRRARQQHQQQPQGGPSPGPPAGPTAPLPNTASGPTALPPAALGWAADNPAAGTRAVAGWQAPPSWLAGPPDPVLLPTEAIACCGHKVKQLHGRTAGQGAGRRVESFGVAVEGGGGLPLCAQGDLAWAPAPHTSWQLLQWLVLTACACSSSLVARASAAALAALSRLLTQEPASSSLPASPALPRPQPPHPLTPPTPSSGHKVLEASPEAQQGQGGQGGPGPAGQGGQGGPGPAGQGGQAGQGPPGQAPQARQLGQGGRQGASLVAEVEAQGRQLERLVLAVRGQGRDVGGTLRLVQSAAVSQGEVLTRLAAAHDKLQRQVDDTQQLLDALQAAVGRQVKVSHAALQHQHQVHALTSTALTQRLAALEQQQQRYHQQRQEEQQQEVKARDAELTISSRSSSSSSNSSESNNGSSVSSGGRSSQEGGYQAAGQEGELQQAWQYRGDCC